MSVAEVTGKKFIQVSLDSSAGNWEMSGDYILRCVRVTGLTAGDYMTFYEAYGNEPRIFKLDSDKAATFFQGRLMTKIGFVWAECSVATPADAVISIEVE